MSDEKKNLDIELLKLDISERVDVSESKHLVTFNLVWPRNQVAGKSCEKALSLVKGKVDFSSAPWYERILFREGVENHCGLVATVSQSLSSEAFDALVRYVGGAIFGGIAGLLSDGIDGIIGDVAGSPLLYARKKAIAAYEAENILTGGMDLELANLQEDQVLELPLLTTETRYEPVSLIAEHGARRRIKDRKGTRLGTAYLRVRMSKK